MGGVGVCGVGSAPGTFTTRVCVLAVSRSAVKPGRATASAPGSPPGRRERRELQALAQLLFPFEPPDRLRVVDPLALALLALEPVGVERRDVQLVEVVRRALGGDCDDEARDRAADASCSTTTECCVR